MTGRTYAWGPQAYANGDVSFRLWAPAVRSLSLEIDGRILPMRSEGDGWFSTVVEKVAPGQPYMFVLPDGMRIPDPASRCQPSVLSPSTTAPSNAFAWKNDAWIGRPWEEAIFYEIHVGAFTRRGTFEAAAEHLPRLADLGFTAIELMPLAQFPGTRGWGYDGVYHYAPHSCYGTPDDLRRLVDAAHGSGLMIFLDVVYNHFGPEGNFLQHYAPEFFRKDDPTPWGDRIDFEKAPVRSFFMDNVLYWLEEFRLDGLRLDAIDQIDDDGDPHILQEISERVRGRINDRHIHLVTENPANGSDLLADLGSGRRLYAADWNDDFHHALHVAVTNESVGYYEPFKDRPWAHVKKALAEGYLREGKPSLNVEPPKTASLPPTAFVHFLQNHDQVGNRARGDRLHTMIDERCFRVLTEIVALSPQIPLFFMGDDHLSTRPFRFFADYTGELAQAVAANRPKEAQNFGGLPEGFDPTEIPDPNQSETFSNSKLDWEDAETVDGAAWSSFLKSLLDLRRTVIVPLLRDAPGYAGSVIGSDEDAIFIDWKLDGGIVRLRANPSKNVRTLEGTLGRLVYPCIKDATSGVLRPWTTHLYVD
jgi:malto-oligosyltrehalose trehalohydrolase